MHKITIFILVISFSISLSAQISLPRLFADGMVLQQQTDVAVWGKAAPGQKVEILVSWSDTTYLNIASKDSTWQIKIKTPEASYEKHNLTVSSGKEMQSLNHILIGEVWLCSGQSNMAFPLRGAPNQGVDGSLDAIVNSENDYVRYFGVQQLSTLEEQDEVQGIWQIASPNTTGSFSAVAYFFARKLQKTLNVPIGIIVSAWGGSRIEAWMSKESLTPFRFIKLPENEEDNKVKMQTPTVLFNGMLNGITGYGIKGVLWYQGESNRDIYKQYPDLFKAMHNDWIKRWDIGDFPIYFAQIAPFAYENMDKAPHSALMREAQLKIASKQPNTGMVVLLDVGDSLCIHPPKKREVGERFAYLALGKTYGMDFLEYQSPQYKSIEIKQDKILVSFDSPMGVAFNENERTGFEIAGSDKKFYPAEVQFDVHFDNVVTLTSEKVSEPVAIRYGWKNYFKATLFGTNGLPVSSFRTDSWDN
ncbi:sialate O-acetylesterase [Maribellus sp. CM-23]|uniref:sialate O-acetylesterase n=1 Tax=Maribellus sp. CM-23 TaxID=2781026 RepID=UPI001F2C4B5D|nr:sialate O-acetylesterase [Maribellus sp. CM-23]MCE4564685.1 sialate O-acetylesterase [Maribellus sp. CM-23]